MRTPLLALVFLALAPAAVSAQADAPADPPATPTCAEQGVAALGVMVPPGRTADEIREAARAGRLAPEGTEVFILPAGHFTRLRNEKEQGERLRGMVSGFLNRNMMVEGTGTVLMLVDENGAVAEVRPSTGNGHVDRQVDRVWRRAQWEPFVVGGCRARAWIHVPLAFTSEQGYTNMGGERRMEVRTGQPR